MKFKKFCDRVTPYGQIVDMDNGDRWLIGSGVGMKIPAGVINLLGASVAAEGMKELVHELTHADVEKRVHLTDAVLLCPDGKASDIVRYFGDAGIFNADFGLLEKRDEHIAVTKTVDDDLKEHTYLLICDRAETVIGFIKCYEKREEA